MITDRDQSNPEPVKFSNELWGVDWSDFFPYTIENSGAIANVCSQDTALEFLDEHYQEIFGQVPEHGDTLSDVKNLYYRRVGDFFSITHNGDLAGVMILNPEDWCTYYIRLAAVRPGHQGAGGMMYLFLYLEEVLRTLPPVTRVTLDTAPGNKPLVDIVNRIGFFATGNNLDDRFGPVTRFTKIINSNVKSQFIKRHLDIPPFVWKKN